MPYSTFTLRKAVEDFDLTIEEGDRFLPNIPGVEPTPLLRDTLKDTLPWAIAVGSEKARSEGIINPVLLDVKRQLDQPISVFSGEEFNVQPKTTACYHYLWHRDQWHRVAIAQTGRPVRIH